MKTGVTSFTKISGGPMSKTAFTLRAFGIYLLVLGAILIFVPNMLLSIFLIQERHRPIASYLDGHDHWVESKIHAGFGVRMDR